MLHSISWSEFIITVTVAIGAYYLAILLLFYYKDIAEYARKKRDSESTSPSAVIDRETPSLIGSIKDFSSSDEEAESNIHDETTILQNREDHSDDVNWQSSSVVTNSIHRSFTQLLEEINTLAYIISKNSKEEISLLFETLLARYPQLAKPHYQSSINQFIIEACQQYGEMTLTTDEINGWWQHALDTTNIHQ
jgi:hypothetical protein